MGKKVNSGESKPGVLKKSSSSSSKRWMQEHVNDFYVKEANKKGLRSRAVFKLEEINKKDKLIRSGMSVVDLGAAPGSWSQWAVDTVGMNGKVIACDILAMDSIAGVDFLQGDFREEAVLDALLKRIGENKLDVVLPKKSRAFIALFNQTLSYKNLSRLNGVYRTKVNSSSRVYHEAIKKKLFSGINTT